MLCSCRNRIADQTDALAGRCSSKSPLPPRSLDRTASRVSAPPAAAAYPAQAAVWARLASQRAAPSPLPSRDRRYVNLPSAKPQPDAWCRCCGARNRVSVRPPRPAGPAPSPRRGDSSAARPRSWVIRMVAMPRSAAIPVRRSITTFCVVTSRPVVGSSAISSAGSHGNRHGDHHALAHAAGQFAGKRPSAFRDREFARPQQLQRLRARFIARHSLVGRNRIGDLVADGTDRIERRTGSGRSSPSPRRADGGNRPRYPRDVLPAKQDVACRDPSG